MRERSKRYYTTGSNTFIKVMNPESKPKDMLVKCRSNFGIETIFSIGVSYIAKSVDLKNDTIDVLNVISDSGEIISALKERFTILEEV